MIPDDVESELSVSNKNKAKEKKRRKKISPIVTTVGCVYNDRKVLLWSVYQPLSIWLPECCLPVEEDLSVISEIAEECYCGWQSVTSKGPPH